MKAEKFGEKRNDAARVVALFKEGHTIDAIVEALDMGEAEVEGILRKAGHGTKGKVRLECQKTGRFWHVHSERAAYRMAQMKGLVDYTYGVEA